MFGGRLGGIEDIEALSSYFLKNKKTYKWLYKTRFRPNMVSNLKQKHTNIADVLYI